MKEQKEIENLNKIFTETDELLKKFFSIAEETIERLKTR